jgi:hypothetical protein
MQRKFNVWPAEQDGSKQRMSPMVGNSIIAPGGVYGSFGPGGQAIAIKLVPNKHRHKLLQEWKVYVALTKIALDQSIIPRCFGLYDQHKFAILVTEFGGSSVG